MLIYFNSVNIWNNTYAYLVFNYGGFMIEVIIPLTKLRGYLCRNHLVHPSVCLSNHHSSPVHIFHMKKRLTFLFHIKIAYDLRVCHDFDQRSFEQVQGHQKEKCKNLNSVHIFYRETLQVLTLQKDCLWLRGVSWFRPKFKINGRKSANFVSGL